MSVTRGPAAILSSLHGALRSVGDALTGPQLEALVRAEAELASAVAELRLLPAALPPEMSRDQLRDDVARVSGALERCLRLGASLEGVTRDALEAQGRTGAYDRQGTESTSAPAGAFAARG